MSWVREGGWGYGQGGGRVGVAMVRGEGGWVGLWSGVKRVGGWVWLWSRVREDGWGYDQG